MLRYEHSQLHVVYRTQLACIKLHALYVYTDPARIMGTLTANQERLPGYCDHKLPTSCRLTSILKCCACADERAHSSTYSTYIDGVGFVQRGLRWQRYCWFCKEFWENRVNASGLRPAQTRIPEVPDQTGFLQRWYDFHRGYRVLRRHDGSEERVAVLGSTLRDVSPGSLPRTMEEMRDEQRSIELPEQAGMQHQLAISSEDVQGPSLEDTLDQMFQAASTEETQHAVAQQDDSSRMASTTSESPMLQASQNSNTAARVELEGSQPARSLHSQAMVATGSRNREYQARRVAALRRELHRMRNGIERVISGLRDLGENVPDHTEATGRLTDLGRTLDVISGMPSREEADRAMGSVNALARSDARASQTDRNLASMQARIDEARQHVNEARRARDQAASELDLADQELRTSQQRLQHAQREQRTTENYIRLFGTPEEVLAQGESYESPIGGMFSRAMDRFRAAEEVRREERTLRQVLVDEARAGGEEGVQRLAELQARGTDVWGVPHPSPQRPDDVTVAETEDESPPERTGELEEYYALLRRQDWTQRPTQITALGRSDVGDPRQGSTEGANQADGFPRNMLNAIVAARVETTLGSNSEVSESMDLSHEPVPYQVDNDASVEVQVAEILAGYRLATSRTDVDHILMRLADETVLRESVGWNIEAVHRLVIDRHNTNTTMWDRDRLRRLLRTEDFMWRAGLPTHRAMRRRTHEGGFSIVEQDQAEGNDVVDNMEAMAEAFQMSAELRRRSGLTAPQQLRMLYRLQAGERVIEDRRTLQQMLHEPSTIQLARETQRLHSGQLDEQEVEYHGQLQRHRRDVAREGDHSRQELNEQRLASRALAVAAGRTAMQTGPQALLQRMADRDDETRMAYRRLQDNGYAPEPDSSTERVIRETIYRPLNIEDYATASDSDSEKDEDQARGLDARDSGRPEAKTDEEMVVKMECRICLTQLAEIACLPCGHLVMCKWCSEQHSPVMAHDRTRPRRAAGCPVCRKNIRQKIRVFRA